MDSLCQTVQPPVLLWFECLFYNLRLSCIYRVIPKEKSVFWRYTYKGPYLSFLIWSSLYRVSQEDSSVFWEHHIYTYIYIYMCVCVCVCVYVCKVKVNWSRYRLDVAQRVGRGIALLFHDRSTRRGWVVNSTPRPHFIPGKDLVPIVQEAGWASGPVSTGGNSRPHRDSIPDLPAHSQSLYRLSYPVLYMYIYIYI